MDFIIFYSLGIMCESIVFIHMTPRLLEALHGISSSFIPCDYMQIGTVLKQFPYIGTLALGSNV